MGTMKVRLVVAVLALSLAGAVLGGPDNYAAGAGGTQPMNLNAVTQSGAYGNPALLGLDRAPGAGLSVLPMSVGVWSNELALPSLLNNYLFDGDWARYFTLFFNESFALWDVKDPSKVSQKLTDEMRGGVGFYFGYQVSPLVFSMNGFSVGLRTYIDLETRLPGGLLLPFFSEKDGLVRGSHLDFSTLSVDLIAATELAVKFGRPLDALPSFFDYLNLDRGAYGVGIKHILGHSYLSVSAEDGLHVDTGAGKYTLNVPIEITSVGIGLNDKWEFGDRYWDSTFLRQPVVGEGWGFDLGAVFHNDNHFVSVDIQDIGMIAWNGSKTHRGRLIGLHLDNVDVSDLFSQFDNFVDSILNIDKVEEDSDRLYTSLPTSLNLGYTYYYDLSDNPYLHYLVKYLTANAGLKQQIVTGPGKNSYTPALSIGGSAGLIEGFIPLRYGLVVGGPVGVGSAVSAGFNTRYVSLDVCYKAVGHPFLVAKKGFEAAAAFTVNWGWDKKKKKSSYIIMDTAVVVPAPEPADSVLVPDTTATISADSVLVSDTAATTPADSVLVPAPEHIAPVHEPTPEHVTPQHEPVHTAPQHEPVPVTPPSAPVHVAPQHEPIPVAPPPAPVPVAPQHEPIPVAPPPAPVPVAPQHAPAPVPAPVPIAPIPAPAPVPPPPALVPVAPIPAPVPVAPQYAPAPVPVAPIPAPVPVAPPPAHAPEPAHQSSTPEAVPEMTLEEAVKKANDLLGTVGFQSGTAELTAASHAALDEAAAIISKHPTARYEIRGYTDFDGANMYVTKASASRATAVKNYIVSKGAPAASIVATGQGRNAKAGGGPDAPEGNVTITPVSTKAQFDALKKIEAEQKK